jgi:uncharacterized protein YggE
MNDITQPARRPWRAALAAALAVAVIAGLAVALDRGDAAPAGANGRTIQVAGVSSFEVAPDRAIFGIGVERDADSAEAARSQASRAFTSLVAAMRAAGVPAERITGDGVRIEPRYAGENMDRVVGFRATATATITVDDVTRVGALIDAATRAGANRVDNVTFTVKDQGAVRRAALDTAVDNGTQEARALARAAGVGLGALQSMSTVESPAMPLYDVKAAASRAELGGDGTEVPTGRITGEVRVVLTFAMS